MGPSVAAATVSVPFQPGQCGLLVATAAPTAYHTRNLMRVFADVLLVYAEPAIAARPPGPFP